MARWLVNPRRTRRKTRRRKAFGAGSFHRPRVSVSVSERSFRLHPHSPYKGRIRRVNPYLRELGLAALSNPRKKRRRSMRRRYHRNPNGLMAAVRNPLPRVIDGGVTAASAILTLAVPNQFLPFAGTDLFSKVLRAASRVAWGGLLYTMGKRVMPGQASSIASGAALAAFGSLVLDLMGTTLILGAGDTYMTAQQLIPSGLSIPGMSGVGAYRRSLSAYSRTGIPAPAGVRGIGNGGGVGGIYPSSSVGMFQNRIYP